MQDITVPAKTWIKGFTRVSTLHCLCLSGHCCNNASNPLDAESRVQRLTKKNWKCLDDFTIKLFLQIFPRCCKYFESTALTPGAGLPLAGYLRVAIYPFILGLRDAKRDLGDVICAGHVPGIHVARVRIYWVLFHLGYRETGVKRLKIKLQLCWSIWCCFGQMEENRK